MLGDARSLEGQSLQMVCRFVSSGSYEDRRLE